MKVTGERFMPDYPGDWSPEHYHRYFLARELVEGKRVLDIASGEGYGSAILAQLAKHVTGVDISQKAVDAARDKYKKDNLDYVCGSVTAIPLPDHSVDMVVSFETIEHLTEQTEMLAEIRRVLIPEGILVISMKTNLSLCCKGSSRRSAFIDRIWNTVLLSPPKRKTVLPMWNKTATRFPHTRDFLKGNISLQSPEATSFRLFPILF